METYYKCKLVKPQFTYYTRQEFILYKNSDARVNSRNKTFMLEYDSQNYFIKMGENGVQFLFSKKYFSSRELEIVMDQLRSIKLKKIFSGDKMEIPFKITKELKEILDYKMAGIKKSYGEIICKKCTDIYGNEYMQDILTGALFPLFMDNSKCVNYFIETYRKGNNRGFSFEFRRSIIKSNDVYQDINVYAVNSGVANKEEIEHYIAFKQKSSSKFLSKTICKWLSKKINKLASKNVQNIQIEFPENHECPKKNIELNPELVIMQRIEQKFAMLFESCDIPSSKLVTLHKNYCSLLNGDTIVNYNNDKDGLLAIECDLDAMLLFNKRSVQNIEAYIENVKISYFRMLTNDACSELNESSLNEIDNVVEIFHANVQEYRFESKRKIMRNIALLYTLELIINGNNYGIQEIKNSHIDLFLSDIILCMKVLYRNGVISTSGKLFMYDEYTVELLYRHLSDIELNIKNIKKIKNSSELLGSSSFVLLPKAED